MIRKLIDRVLKPWRAQDAAPVVPRPKLNISHTALATMRTTTGEAVNPFQMPSVVPHVISSANKLATDNVMTDAYSYAALDSTFTEGVGFMGFPALAALTQRSEYRRPAEIIAKEMTRKWIKLQAAGEEDKTEKLRAIDAEMKRLNVRELFSRATLQDGLYGRSQIYIDVGTSGDELKTPLVDNVTKIPKGTKLSMRVIEPIWTYPNKYNADNPLRADYFKPQTWFVMGEEVHETRLVTFVSKEMPDLLKPAYAFSGLSMTQILVPYVNNWLRTRQSVSDILHSFSVFVLETDMSSVLAAGGGAAEQARFELFNAVRDNMGILAINKDTEAFKNVSVPLGSLDHLQAQSQEHMSAVVSIPLVILLGITPSGLNASSAADLDVFYSYIAAQQVHLFTAPLTRIVNVIQLSLFGEIDPDIGYRFEPLRALDETQLVNARKTEAETDCMFIDRGVISPEEARGRVANQFESAYHGLDIAAVPDEIPPTDKPLHEEETDHPSTDPS